MFPNKKTNDSAESIPSGAFSSNIGFSLRCSGQIPELWADNTLCWLHYLRTMHFDEKPAQDISPWEGFSQTTMTQFCLNFGIFPSLVIKCMFSVIAWARRIRSKGSLCSSPSPVQTSLFAAVRCVSLSGEGI